MASRRDAGTQGRFGLLSWAWAQADVLPLVGFGYLYDWVVV